MITDRDIPGLRRLWQDAFGDTDAFLDKFFSVGFSFDRCNCIRQEDKIAAALYWFDCNWNGKKVAYIYAVATDSAFRGKGLCRALMEDTHRRLAASGYGGAVLVPAKKALFEMYQKFGYRGFCPVERMTVCAESIPAATELSPAEYRALRQALLGENSILQESPALEFLATYGRFYKAPGFLFCGYRDGSTFCFEEALGNASILKNAQRESFQAMYLPLDDSENLPDYFSIPLN